MAGLEAPGHVKPTNLKQEGTEMALRRSIRGIMSRALAISLLAGAGMIIVGVPAANAATGTVLFNQPFHDDTIHGGAIHRGTRVRQGHSRTLANERCPAESPQVANRAARGADKRR